MALIPGKFMELWQTVFFPEFSTGPVPEMDRARLE